MRACIVAALLAGVPAAAQDSSERLNPVTWTLAAPPQAKPGGRFTAKLTARISEGWHLYSLKEFEGGPIPTSVAVPAGQSFRLAGAIEAPAPVTAHEEAFGMDVEFYLGEVDFGVPLETAAETKAATANLTVTARYQACDNKQCLPPKTVRLERAVEIGAR